MAKTTITNTAEGARGVLLADGTTHYVEPGQTVELEVATDHDLYDGLVEGDADAEKPLAKMNKAELIAEAEKAGVTTAKDKDGNDVAVADATNAQIVAAIEEARAA